MPTPEVMVHVVSCALCTQPIAGESSVAGVTVYNAATGQGEVVGFRAHVGCLAAVLRPEVGQHVRDIFGKT